MRIFLFLFHYLYRYTNIKELLGYDERYTLQPDNFKENVSYEKIIYLFEIKQKLDLLELVNSTQLYEELIENENTIQPLSIKNGGLFDDFLFIFPY